MILARETVLKDQGIAPEVAKGNRYIADEKTIRRYLAAQYDQPLAG